MTLRAECRRCNTTTGRESNDLTDNEAADFRTILIDEHLKNPEIKKTALEWAKLYYRSNVVTNMEIDRVIQLLKHCGALITMGGKGGFTTFYSYNDS